MSHVVLNSQFGSFNIYAITESYSDPCCLFKMYFLSFNTTCNFFVRSQHDVLSKNELRYIGFQVSF